eukprot:gene19269-biopygen20519
MFEARAATHVVVGSAPSATLSGTGLQGKQEGGAGVARHFLFPGERQHTQRWLCQTRTLFVCCSSFGGRGLPVACG